MKALSVLFVLPLLAQTGVNFYSVEKERALGQHLASEIRQRSKPLDNPVLDAYVKRMGKQLVSHLGEAPFPYSFEVLLTAEASEPMSIPGGHIFIPAGFFLAAQDEAEFAGMLGHSIGHAALRHGTRTATRGQIVNMASIPLVFMGGWMGAHADSQGRAPLVPIGFLGFQRGFELEADKFGLELAARAGHDPAAFRRYIQRTQPADSNMSPLPARELRLARIEEIPRPAANVPPSSSDEFLRAQEAAREALGKPEPRGAPTLRR